MADLQLVPRTNRDRREVTRYQSTAHLSKIQYVAHSATFRLSRTFMLCFHSFHFLARAIPALLGAVMLSLAPAIPAFYGPPCFKSLPSIWPLTGLLLSSFKQHLRLGEALRSVHHSEGLKPTRATTAPLSSVMTPDLGL